MRATTLIATLALTGGLIGAGADESAGKGQGGDEGGGTHDGISLTE
jgi:hypothetical protein